MELLSNPVSMQRPDATGGDYGVVAPITSCFGIGMHLALEGYLTTPK